MTDAIAPEKININGVDYDPADAQSLIEAGSKARDFEKQWNTSLDKVYPDYTRATQEAARAKQLEEEARTYKQKIDEYERLQKQAETPEENRKALQAARELGLADQEYLRQNGYLTKSELEKILDEKQRQQDSTLNILNQADGLEKEITGEDGRVPFNKKAVLAYASTYQIPDLRKAYEEMNEAVNARWKEQQIEGSRKIGLTTLKNRGVKDAPEQKQVTKDNFDQVLKETLWGGQEE